MRKQLFSLALLLLIGIATIHAQNWRYDFSAVSSSGDTLYYKVNRDSLSVTVTSPSHLSGDFNNWDRTMPSGNVTIPSVVSNSGNTYSVTAIGDGAFSCCSGIETITIPNSVVSIERAAFLNCHSLSSVVLPNSLSVISQETFKNCYNLGEVAICNSVTEIGAEAFARCTSLTPVIVPNTVSTIGRDAFAAVKMVQYTGDAVGAPWGAVCINGYVEDSLYYTSNVKDTLIGAYPSIVTADIPTSVRVILSSAFGGFRIGERSFTKGCEHLISVNVPNSVTSIGSNAFNGCKKLTSITLPHSLIYIGGSAFARCTKLDTLYFNAGNLAHFRYSTITDVYVYDWVVDSSSRNALKYLYIGDSVRNIEQNAFSGCTSLASVAIPNSVTSIGNRAFSDCRRLASVTIPNSVTSIGDETFENCTSLASVYYNAVDAYVDAAYYGPFSGGTNITSFVFGDSVRTIPRRLCQGLTGLSSVDIPNSVTSSTHFLAAQASNLSITTPKTALNTITCSSSYPASIPCISGTECGSFQRASSAA